MIIQVCGTNGSGKTTAMRAVMAQLEEFGQLLVGGKQYGTIFHDPARTDPHGYVVMGRYGEAATGGCDRISDVKSVRPEIRRQADNGFDVLFEGIRMTNPTDGAEFCARYVRDGGRYVVVLLKTPLEDCLAGIRARQLAGRGGERDVVVKDIASNVTRNRNYAAKLADVGARVIYSTREDAPAWVLKELRGQA